MWWLACGESSRRTNSLARTPPCVATELNLLYHAMLCMFSLCSCYALFECLTNRKAEKEEKITKSFRNEEIIH